MCDQRHENVAVHLPRVHVAVEPSPWLNGFVNIDKNFASVPIEAISPVNSGTGYRLVLAKVRSHAGHAVRLLFV